MTQRRTTLLATLALLAVTACWGSTFFLIRDLLDRVPTLDFLAIRFAIAGIVLVAVFPRAISRLAPDSRRHALVLGGLYGLAQILQTAGLAHTPASVSGFITGMYVVFTPLLAALILRTRISGMTWGAVALAAAGLGVLTLEGFSVGYGEALTLVAAGLYALHIVGLGAWSRPSEALGMSIVQILVIATICLLASAPGGMVLPDRLGDWLSIVYMAIVAGAFALIGQTWAQAHLPPTRSAIVMSMEPVFAAFFAVTLGGEGVTGRMLVGGAMVLAAMIVVELVPRRHVEGEGSAHRRLGFRVRAGEGDRGAAVCRVRPSPPAGRAVLHQLRARGRGRAAVGRREPCGSASAGGGIGRPRLAGGPPGDRGRPRDLAGGGDRRRADAALRWRRRLTTAPTAEAEPTTPLVTTPIAPSTSAAAAPTPTPTPRPTAQPTEQAGTASVTAPPPAPDGVSLDGSPVTYAATNLVDGQPTTAWRMPGDGSGQSIAFTFPAPVTLSRVGLVNGYAKTDGSFDWYSGNRRVLAAQWRFEDGTTVDQPLGESRDLQVIKVGPVTTTTVTLTLTTVSPPGTGASSRDFTAISEVSLVGTPEG